MGERGSGGWVSNCVAVEAMTGVPHLPACYVCETWYHIDNSYGVI